MHIRDPGIIKRSRKTMPGSTHRKSDASSVGTINYYTK